MRAFNTSVEVFVEVFAANIKGGDNRPCNHTHFLLWVSMRSKGTPIKKITPSCPRFDKRGSCLLTMQ
ncbi:MAG: hypothetical protein IPQ04_14375 [Saprospiraceae bacterium]|nr:hypothetical protein [Saprospiraceae bacterium]